jgi:hypothetical protein
MRFYARSCPIGSRDNTDKAEALFGCAGAFCILSLASLPGASGQQPSAHGAEFLSLLPIASHFLIDVR